MGAALSLLLAPGKCLAVESPAELLESLRQTDSQYLSEYTVRCSVLYPVSALRGAPGVHLRDLTVTSVGGTIATSSTFLRFLEPKEAVETNRELQGEANPDSTSLRARVKSLTLQEPGFVGTLDSYAFIAADGTLEGAVPEEGFHMAQLDNADPWRPKRSTEDDLGILTMGRGYSKQIDMITRITQVDDGMLHVEAVGRAYNKTCQWELSIDVRNALMVRSARAWREDNGFQYVAMRNEGLRSQESLPMPETATYWEPGFPDKLDNRLHKYDVSFLDYQRTADQALIKSARRLLRKELPRGTEVHDYREGDGSEPVKYIVGETDVEFTQDAQDAVEDVQADALRLITRQEQNPTHSNPAATDLSLAGGAPTGKHLRRASPMRRLLIGGAITIMLVALSSGLYLASRARCAPRVE